MREIAKIFFAIANNLTHNQVYTCITPTKYIICLYRDMQVGTSLSLQLVCLYSAW